MITSAHMVQAKVDSRFGDLARRIRREHFYIATAGLPESRGARSTAPRFLLNGIVDEHSLMWRLIRRIALLARAEQRCGALERSALLKDALRARVQRESAA